MWFEHCYLSFTSRETMILPDAVRIFQPHTLITYALEDFQKTTSDFVKKNAHSAWTRSHLKRTFAFCHLFKAYMSTEQLEQLNQNRALVVDDIDTSLYYNFGQPLRRGDNIPHSIIIYEYNELLMDKDIQEGKFDCNVSIVTENVILSSEVMKIVVTGEAIEENQHDAVWDVVKRLEEIIDNKL